MPNRGPPLKTEPVDMDSFFDFNQGTTPIVASSSKADGTPKTAVQDWNQASPYNGNIMRDEQQQFSGPSHDYSQYRQTVGLPAGSVTNVPAMSNLGMMEGFNSGIGDMGVDAGMAGWSSGVDIDTDMAIDFNSPHTSVPTSFTPVDTDCFVNPNTVGAGASREESVSHVGRLWPGMHSQQAQQAAMQKAAQAHAVQQRQMKLQAQQAHFRQLSQSAAQHGQPSAKRPATHTAEPHVEQSISRLLNQMRHGSSASSHGDEPSGSMSNIARMKKDEDDMDEDERLLASEEGKKLSSKERRQLRNKVSARAFRSRRKGEFIW